MTDPKAPSFHRRNGSSTKLVPTAKPICDLRFAQSQVRNPLSKFTCSALAELVRQVKRSFMGRITACALALDRSAAFPLTCADISVSAYLYLPTSPKREGAQGD